MPCQAAVRPEIKALAVPLCLSAFVRVNVPALVDQFVKPLSTHPLTAKLPLEEDELVDDVELVELVELVEVDDEDELPV